MEDILLMQFLKKKGIISDKDIHEFHELTSASIYNEPIYSAKTGALIIQENNHININEEEAEMIVENMYHTENGKKYIGEKFDINKSKEVYNKYKNILPKHISMCEVYIAINAHYHDYCVLFKSWFNDNIDSKIIESAIIYWFLDEDCVEQNKVLKYFKTM